MYDLARQWRWPFTDFHHGLLRPSSRLLEAFVRLPDAADVEIAAYAKRWEELGLCQHGLPMIHNWTIAGSIPQDACGARALEEPETLEEAAHLLATKTDDYWKSIEDWNWEPLEAWRAWARRARELVNLAALTNLGQLADFQAWKSADFYPSRENTLAEQRHELCKRTDTWIGLGEVRPHLEVRGSHLTVTLGGFGLFGALATQLLLVVSRTRGFAVCSGCGKPYVPRRRRTSERLNYCPNCGLKAAWRDAQRRLRNAQTTARQLHNDGTPVRVIAKQLDRTIPTIRKWVRG